MTNLARDWRFFAGFALLWFVLGTVMLGGDGPTWGAAVDFLLATLLAFYGGMRRGEARSR